MPDLTDMNYNMTDYQLQWSLIFWICVAGKTSTTTHKGLNKFFESIQYCKGDLPFEKITQFGYKELPQRLKECGIGCYSNKARSIWELVNSGIDLRICMLEELERIYGIGFKTSRCFMLHTRKNAQCAGLDTHILKFLRSKGHDVPTSTPGNKKVYTRLEKLFIKYAKESGKSTAEFDAEIWKSYAFKEKNNVVQT